MLTNGITLKVGTSKESLVLLNDLKEVPDIGGDPELVENTRLNAKYKQYEVGVGDAGDLVYKFVYDNSSASSDYRVLRGYADAGNPVFFQQAFPDGTLIDFEATIALKIISAGGINTPVEFDVTCGLASDLEITNPSEGA